MWNSLPYNKSPTLADTLLSKLYVINIFPWVFVSDRNNSQSTTSKHKYISMLPNLEIISMERIWYFIIVEEHRRKPNLCDTLSVFRNILQLLQMLDNFVYFL